MNNFPIFPASNLSRNQRKPIYGVGINDADYRVTAEVNGKTVKCPFYRKWSSMMRRCYDLKRHEKQPTYIGCTVCDEWLIFSNFRAWMVTQDWENKELDKDIKVKGNKIYSPETCLFITRDVNHLFVDSNAARGEYPIGVCFNKLQQCFAAICSENGKSKFIGNYKTPEEAHQAYRAEKNEQIKRAIIKHPEISFYLQNHLHLKPSRSI